MPQPPFPFLRGAAVCCLALGLLATAGCSGNGDSFVNTPAPSAAGPVAVPVNFAAPTNFAVGSQPWGIAGADFNVDGNLDLVVTNSNAGNISILLGNGAGGFGAATNLAVNNTPEGVAVGNIDGVNGPDIAVNNRDSNNVTIFLNNGSGTFAQAGNSPFAVGNAPEGGIVLADFDGDGDLDLASACHDSSDVVVRLGDGTGNFGAATSFDAGAATGTFGLVAGDFNGNGTLDLAAANHDGNQTEGLAVLLGAGNGTFGAPSFFTAGLIPQGIASADFNGNGALDLVLADNFSDNANVFLNDGNANFGTATNFAVGSNPVYGCSALDINKDLKPDITITNSGADNFSFLLGDGTGSFAAATNVSTGAASSPVGLLIADLNGDTLLDVVTANLGTDNISVLLRQ